MAIAGEPIYGPWYGGNAAGTWQCGTCLAWVPYGSGHACPPPTSVTVTGMDFTAEDRIASALERIAAALERTEA